MSLVTDEVFVLEVNPRSSRTVPFLSKITNVPMANIATKVILGQTLIEQGYTTGLDSRKAWRICESSCLLICETTSVLIYHSDLK